jgi:heme oxygenase
MAISDRRFHLRDHTRALHDRLDNQIGAFAGASDYAAYLQGMARFRMSAEAWMNDASLPDTTWRPRRIADLLQSDLIDLGLAAPEAETINALRDTPSHVLGALYVIEGAVLGGQVLAVRARALGFDASFGARHLADAEQGLASWRGYLDALDRCETYDPDAALAAANAMFAAAVTMFAPDDSGDVAAPGENGLDHAEHVEHRPVLRQVPSDVVLKARQVR